MPASAGMTNYDTASRGRGEGEGEPGNSLVSFRRLSYDLGNLILKTFDLCLFKEYLKNVPDPYSIQTMEVL